MKTKNSQYTVEDTVKTPLDEMGPDGQLKASYWRKQYEELVKQNDHNIKERKWMGRVERLLCYTIYVANCFWTTTMLCNYDATEEWDSFQRFLWCLVLAMNVGFAIFVLMSRMLINREKEWTDRYWNMSKEMLKMRGKLDIAEHNLECAEEKLKNTDKSRQKPDKTTKK